MDVAAWLHGLGLGQHAQAFADNAVDARVLRDLTADDLREMGVTAVGHRRLILAAIARLGTETPETPVARSAERRQLTVMFVDLVGSTELAGRLDPEEMGEVLKAYQNAVAGEITRFEGHVAKLMGDGVLAYFGWPRAHEDEAERAVRAGLAVTGAVARIAGGGAPLACRVGIATGLVVVGELVGEGAAREEAVVGETPNLAARLQALAQPGQVVVAEGTRRLLGAGFELADLGPQALKGLAQPVEAFAVRGERAVASRFEARSGPALRPMVGREQELALLRERWARAVAGEGQAVLLVGEAGIGKSRLSRALIDWVADDAHLRITWQCSPYHTDSPLHPAILHITRAAGIVPDEQIEQSLDKLEALLRRTSDAVRSEAPLVAALLGLDGRSRYGELRLAPQKLRANTLDVLMGQLIGLAAQQPVLFVIEDAHWIDPTTRELIQLTLGRVSRARVLMLVTARPSFGDGFAEHPLVTRVVLGRLDRAWTAAIMSRLTGGKTLPESLVDEIASRTDGVPLYIEEMTKAVLESGVLRETGDAWQLEGPASKLAIPASLHDSLMARLDRLHTVKEVAQTAAVIGRSFSFDLLAAVSSIDGQKLAEMLGQLEAAELIYRRGKAAALAYEFKHALVQEVAYQSLLKRRRLELHARIAQALEQQFSTIANSGPEVVAHHLTEAGLALPAADHWLEAGRRAMQRSANIEAERHLQKGLSVLRDLPEDPERQRREIALQNTLGVCLMPTRGFGNREVAEAFSRAASIAEEAGDARGLFVALRGKGQYQMISGDLPTAREQAARILGLAQELNDHGALIEAHHLGWSALAFTGDFTAAQRHAEIGIALYDRQRDHDLTYAYSGHDPGVCCRCFGALALWQLGFPDRAMAQCREGEQLARDVAHPFSVTIALWASGMLRVLRREPDATRETGEAMIAHCSENGFAPFVPMGRIYRAGACAELNDPLGGILELREAIRGLRASGTQYTVPLFFAWLGELCGKAGRIEEGLAAVEQGRRMSELTADQFSWPEFDRIGGNLLLARSGPSRAEARVRLERSLRAATATGAKCLELRAARDLARLLAGQGERQQALDLLAPIYAWFTDGLDTPDLVEARALLDALK